MMFVSGLGLTFFLVFKNLNIPLLNSICGNGGIFFRNFNGDENLHPFPSHGNVHSNPGLYNKKSQ